jgi:uncharacterized protein
MPGKKAVRQLPLLPLAVFVIAVVLVFSYANSPFSRANTRPQSAVVSVGGYSYNVLLAFNQSQWERGLMNYTFSCTEPGACTNGMLFVFPYNGSECFWMKDTPQPLYQVWISGNVVTNVYNAVPEDTTSVCAYGNEVLELYSRLPLNLSVGEDATVSGLGRT